MTEETKGNPPSTPDDAVTPPVARRRGSWLKKVGIGISAFLLLIMLALVLLVGTTPGLHLLLNGASRFVPGLDIASVSGGWRDLTLKDVSYQMPGVTVKTEQFHLSLALGCLRKSQLCINDLSAKNIDVVVDTAALPATETPVEPSEPLTELSAPFPISLNALTLDNVNVTLDDTAISLGSFRTGMQWEGRALSLLPTKVSALLVALPKTPIDVLEDGKITASDVADVVKETTATVRDAVENGNSQTIQIDKTLTVAPSQPRTTQTERSTNGATAPQEQSLGERLTELFSKSLLPDLPQFTLPLDLTISDIHGEQLRLTGDQDILISDLIIQASTKNQHLQLDRLIVQSPQGGLNVRGEATLSKNWPVSLSANGVLNVAPLKGEKLKLTVTGGLREQLDVMLNLSGPQRAQLTLQTELAEAGLPLALTLETAQVRWPLVGETQYQANDIRLRFNGKMTDYALSLRGEVRGADLPPATLLLDGKGNVEQFNLSRLRIAALQGNADLSAVVDWSKAISWRSELLINGINTAKQWPEWPAKVDGKIAIRGSIYGGSWQLQVPELRLDGNVKENKLTARGELRGNAAGQWNIPGINLALGRNQLNVKGDLNDKWQLDADINAPGLNGILPGLAGRVLGNLKLRGKLNEPQILADLTASGLRWQTMTIGQIKVDGNIRSEASSAESSSSIPQIAGKLAVRLEQLRQDGLSIGLLTLNADGNEKQHQLQLNLEGEPVSGQLALSGSFDRQAQRWRGSLSNTRFDTPVGEWRLTQNMALDYQNAQQKISIGTHCWRNPNAELCVPKTIEAGPSGQASIRLNRFDLAMVKPFLGADTALEGTFSGGAEFSWQADQGLPQAKITLVGNNVNVKQQVQGNALPVTFDTFTLNAGLDRGRAQLGWVMAIRDNGRFSGDIYVTDPQGRRNLGGNVAINSLSLAMLKPILRKGEKAEGTLNANLRLAGNAERPQVFGQMALERLDVDGSWMPIDLTTGRLALSFNGMSSTLQGFLKTDNGQLNLGGNADWSQPDAWRARIAAKGQRIRVTVPPTARLDVSPDIVFEATPQLFALNGSVGIPWARIVVKDMPESAVDVSSDEVLLDAQRQPLEKASASIPINSNLVIRVGNDVRLDAFGLVARLQGDLKMVQDARGLGLNGQIDIPSGRFKAYGQDLIVRKGQILFSGPPDQPILNIEAIRNPDSTENNVTAGVRVTGMASTPKLEIFSDPAMSQQEALSYLLRGQGLDSGGADSSAMTSALVGLGVAQSGQVVGKIGEAFGVSNLALDTQGVGDNSQVVVSGYVLPGLQVKYGVGIFDSLATLTLRYRLMPKLYLEAVSGINQALDVLYQFEF